MNPERREQIKQVFNRACDLPPDKRSAFLDEVCAGDPDLRDLVDALLAQYEAVAGSAVGLSIASTAEQPSSGRRLQVGDVIDGKYRIEAAIGAGGMGEVYRARQLALDRVVAVKVLPTDAHAGSGRRFQREALTVARLRHPHIVTVHDLGLAPGLGAYLVMEYVEGRSLRDELQQRRSLPVPEAVELMRQVCAGVAAAHAGGVIHRDLKPENILLEGEGNETTAKVADFGIAKLAEQAEAPVESLTGTGVLVGTPRYMSPEQCLGDELDARSDVYSLGVILYETVTGVRPFQAESALGLLHKHVSEAPPPLRARVPGVSDELERVVAQALAKKPEQRWQSAAELGRALAALTHGASADTVPASASSGSGSLAGTSNDSIQTYVLPYEAEVQAGAAPPPTNLPNPQTRCIGRERELDQVASLLGDPQVRLITLTGAGGTGKTRLACEAALALLANFPDGAFIVELAALGDAEMVAPYVGGALGVSEAPGTTPAEALKRYVSDKRMLLVLDNFEHLVDAAPFLTELLASAPGLRLIVTSRALLHLRNEHELVVDPLEVPPRSGRRAVTELLGMPAVALFIERAREAKPAFELTDENAAAVAEICRRLDGLPLAIELAAARVKLLAPQAMLARLESRLKLLTGGARDLPGRQQTMRGAMAWSYDLLDDQEKVLLQRIAVFAGGCTLEAAEAVGGSADVDVLDGIGSLADKSLVRQREEGGEPRFTMLEVVREFALEQLEASGVEHETRLAHARFVLAMAVEAEPHLTSHNPGEWLERLRRENENVRAALSFLLEREPELGAKLAAAVGMYFRLANQYTEGRVWLERARSSAGEPATRAEILSYLSFIARVLGDMRSAIAYGEAGLEASRASGDRLILARSLNALATAALSDATSLNLAAARAYLEEGLGIARTIEASGLTATILNNLGEIARTDGDLAAARSYYEQCHAASGLNSRSILGAIARLNLGAVTYELGDLAAALKLFKESLTIALELDDQLTAANVLDGLAALALDRGDAERSARLAGATEAIYRTLGVTLDANEQALRDRLVARLGETLERATLEAEWARGRTMSLEAAVQEALASE